ncbi:MAG TPA: SDR family NAD(P)-dependent oxidoreductase [Gaiellaceae bacterium]|jgi:3-oxoacyl-[acyl-carrier protein] reductase/pyridoxal 4-dehydrogenase|nr:SDR family NAD(P)-dependent oxidoreductase [Gaiellaceae bacterium]
MGKLDNRVAVVTGAAQGIGKAVADKLAAEGATVVGADIQPGTTVTVDVSKEDDVRRMVDETVAEHGKLDVLVNAAAIVPFTPWDDIDFVEWRRIMAVNLDGTFLTNHYAQKAMREKGYGRIVNIDSNVVLAGTPNLAHYVASKGGVLAFTRALAREIGQYGITVNAVAPGLTETEGVMASPHKEAFEFVQMLQCIPRRGVASDIAPAVAFLASEEAGWVTGQLLVADGGMSHN